MVTTTTDYRGGSAGGKVEGGTPFVQIVGDGKVDGQVALVVSSQKEPQVSAKGSAEGTFGVDETAGPFSFKPGFGGKTEVEVKAPVSPDAILSGRTISEAKVEVRQSTVAQSELGGTAQIGVSPDRVSIDGKATHKEEVKPPDPVWTGGLGDVIPALKDHFFPPPPANLDLPQQGPPGTPY